VRRTDNFTTICADCLEIWELQPTGNFRDCTEIALSFPRISTEQCHQPEQTRRCPGDIMRARLTVIWQLRFLKLSVSVSRDEDL
jgi:hypothetical protein